MDGECRISAKLCVNQVAFILANKYIKAPMCLKAILFDMDGTIVDVPYDWKRIKQDMGTGGEPILSHISTLPPSEKKKKWRILETYEDQATAKAVLKKGIAEFLDFLSKNHVQTALVTNNSRKNVSLLLERFQLRFNLVLSRESGLWKPSGAPLRAAMRKLNLKPFHCCVIGDSFFDVLAARDAGINRVFILNCDRKRFEDEGVETACTVAELEEKIRPLLS